mmetsp:Transcript_68816/g.159532  ORF Transcript_68816/g.159532 Transcript_68816/m.159532 type:complete len:139 (+) Transcript_68816:121-537(+)|eukprot:CAMPEP_0171090204 /NCGR_PEP_ID=MMETSP0766_2-20121228/29572_1 /TAXON_ID=439317 /ORGANISM="Gambierdiscus australes, Strain CAWD 149" /LENGTH=138 /DNA_ID=CAMNT_0011548173 /DNA_START=120 /DNA_END=536 /DNA_ORIENTATION=-
MFPQVTLHMSQRLLARDAPEGLADGERGVANDAACTDHARHFLVTWDGRCSDAAADLRLLFDADCGSDAADRTATTHQGIRAGLAAEFSFKTEAGAAGHAAKAAVVEEEATIGATTRPNHCDGIVVKGITISAHYCFV